MELTRLAGTQIGRERLVDADIAPYLRYRERALAHGVPYLTYKESLTP